MIHSITDILLPFALAILAVTFIDVFGSITSRKWKYNYGYLTLASLLVYTAIGYHLAPNVSLVWALIVGGLVGIYDSTIGWKIGYPPKRKHGQPKRSSAEITDFKQNSLDDHHQHVFRLHRDVACFELK